MRLIVLLLAALWCETSSSYAQQQQQQQQQQQDNYDRSTSWHRTVPRRFSRVWKRQQQQQPQDEQLGYLEQCSILQFWDKQIGRVNVLAFLDSSWQFSHRQATMLKVLRERFERTGFRNIQFFAVNAAPGESSNLERAELEAEEETWRQISPSEAEGVPAIQATPEALVEALGPNIYFIQDNEELQIWPKLRVLRDQILVIDRCGRLTYQVIVPWSILHFPYVKAAILSTYKDEPCGHCEFQESPFDTSTSSASESRTNPASTSTSPPLARTNNNDDNDENESSGYDQTTANYHTQIGTEESPSTLTPLNIYEDDDTTIRPTTTNYNEEIISEEEARFVTSTPSMSEEMDESSTTTVPITEAETSSTLIYPTDSEETTMITTSTIVPETEVVTSTENEESGQRSDSEPSSMFGFNDDYFANFNFTADESSDGSSGVDTTTTTASGEIDLDAATEYEGTTVTEPALDDATDRFITQQQDSTEIPMTTEISNLSLATNESRLKKSDDDDIESIDSLDVLKSRSTNARSVSPNEGTENHLEDVETNSEPSKPSVNDTDALNNKTDYLLPIRIIMRAPHVDEYSDRSMKAHEYLVLKTGEPDYHDHLDSGEPSGLRKDDGTNGDTHVRKKSDALSRTFGKDESPGLYGEVADYWRNFGNEQYNDSSQTGNDNVNGNNEEDDEDAEEAEDEEQIVEHDTGLVQEELASTATTTTGKPSNSGKGNAGPMATLEEEKVELDNDKPYDGNPEEANEDVDVVDEEAKSKLIAHYSKLLPWLYYVLAK